MTIPRIIPLSEYDVQRFNQAVPDSGAGVLPAMVRVKIMEKSGEGDLFWSVNAVNGLPAHHDPTEAYGLTEQVWFWAPDCATIKGMTSSTRVLVPRWLRRE